MADRFPLILNTSSNQIQEIASGDNLDMTGNNIKSVSQVIFAGMTTTARDALTCLLYTSPSPRDLTTSRMPSSA